MTRRQRNNLLIGIFVIAMVFMGVGYAMLSQELTTTGNPDLDSFWEVEITKVESSFSDGASSIGQPTYKDTEITVDYLLTEPGAVAYYEVTVENKSNFDAKLYGIRKTEIASPLVASIDGVYEGNVLKVGEKVNVVVSIRWNGSDQTKPDLDKLEGSFTFKLDYFQDK